jgi:hypothetical protein
MFIRSFPGFRHVYQDLLLHFHLLIYGLVNDAASKILGWHAVAQLLEALCYKQEGRGFDSR